MKKKDKRVQNLERYVARQNILDWDIDSAVEKLHCCIVIPAFHERNLIQTLHSIAECDKPTYTFEVIVVLNSSEQSEEAIRVFHRYQQKELHELNFLFPVHTILIENIPVKKAGVGYARKTGMDVAASRLLETDPINGIIVCLDGDCQVSTNYLQAIQEHFLTENAKQAAHLYFEHPFPQNRQLKSSIIAYEIHLRLMKLNLQIAGHPQAYHAVGSCLAVLAWAYAAQGGMNKRQAGEDFYFIHKFSNIGQLDELNNATVYPSARKSDRVPFGTGAAMNKNMAGQEQLTYHPNSYIQIKRIISAIPEFYNEDYAKAKEFLEYKKVEIIPKLNEIRNNTTSITNFRSRFFQWFDAFQVFKFLHYLRDLKYPDVEIAEANSQYFNQINIDFPKDVQGQLLLLRKIERSTRSN